MNDKPTTNPTAQGAIPEEQPTQKFSLRCTQCGDLHGVNIPMNEPGFAYSGKCNRCGGEVVLDNYQKPAEEQDKGIALERVFTQFRASAKSMDELRETDELIAAARAESTTLHKMVREMVEAANYVRKTPCPFPISIPGCVMYDKRKNWLAKRKRILAVLARAKEIGEGR